MKYPRINSNICLWWAQHFRIYFCFCQIYGRQQKICGVMAPEDTRNVAQNGRKLYFHVWALLCWARASCPVMKNVQIPGRETVGMILQTRSTTYYGAHSLWTPPSIETEEELYMYYITSQKEDALLPGNWLILSDVFPDYWSYKKSISELGLQLTKRMTNASCCLGH